MEKGSKSSGMAIPIKETMRRVSLKGMGSTTGVEVVSSRANLSQDSDVDKGCGRSLQLRVINTKENG